VKQRDRGGRVPWVRGSSSTPGGAGAMGQGCVLAHPGRAGAMTIVLNGESREVPEGSSVTSLLRELQIQDEQVAVELNLTIVDRRAFERTSLREGDRLEVLGFIGGGEEAAE
jgi:sulfur carrier protein